MSLFDKTVVQVRKPFDRPLGWKNDEGHYRSGEPQVIDWQLLYVIVTNYWELSTFSLVIAKHE